MCGAEQFLFPPRRCRSAEQIDRTGRMSGAGAYLFNCIRYFATFSRVVVQKLPPVTNSRHDPYQLIKHSPKSTMQCNYNGHKQYIRRSGVGL